GGTARGGVRRNQREGHGRKREQAAAAAHQQPQAAEAARQAAAAARAQQQAAQQAAAARAQQQAAQQAAAARAQQQAAQQAAAARAQQQAAQQAAAARAQQQAAQQAAAAARASAAIGAARAQHVPPQRRWSAMAPQLDIVEMRLLAGTENADELVLASIERSLVGVRFHPDRQVQDIAIDGAAGLEQLAHVTPIHAYKMHGATAGDRRGCRQSALEELHEIAARKLTRRR